MILPFHVNQRQLSVALLLGSFFAAALLFPFATRHEPGVWNSPDETANAVFAELLASGEPLAIAEPLNREVRHIVRPRSVTVRNDALVPVSFPGALFLLGGVGAMVGSWAIPFVSATLLVASLFAILGAWTWRWGRQRAFVAVALVATHGGILYFTARGLYHNVIFLSFFLLAWWAYEWWRTRGSSSALAGAVVFIIVALLTRTVEALWLMPLCAVAILTERARLTKRDGAEVLATLVAVAGVLWMVASVYELRAVAEYQPLVNGQPVTGLRALATMLLPFGFHPLRALEHFILYQVWLFPVFTFLTALGVWRMWRKREGWGYLACAIAVSVLLALYYGSATLRDSVGVDAVTIGNSYVRYWLPLVVLWAPIAAEAFLWGVGRVAGPFFRSGAVVVLVLLAGNGFWQAYFDRTEGLALVAERIGLYKTVRRDVLSRTGEDAVIVSDHSDKVFFPDRRVVTPGDRPLLTYPEIAAGLPTLVDRAPVYYYASSVSQDERDQFSRIGILLGTPLSLPDGAWLFPLVRL